MKTSMQRVQDMQIASACEQVRSAITSITAKDQLYVIPPDYAVSRSYIVAKVVFDGKAYYLYFYAYVIDDSPEFYDRKRDGYTISGWRLGREADYYKLADAITEKFNNIDVYDVLTILYELTKDARAAVEKECEQMDKYYAKRR